MDKTSMTLGWLAGRRIAAQRKKLEVPEQSGVYDDEWPIAWNASAVANNAQVSSGGMTFRKISNLTPDSATIATWGATATVAYDGETVDFVAEYMQSTDSENVSFNAFTIKGVESFIFLVVSCHTAGFDESTEITWPETGLYYAFLDSTGNDCSEEGVELSFKLGDADEQFTSFEISADSVKADSVTFTWSDMVFLKVSDCIMSYNDIYMSSITGEGVDFGNSIGEFVTEQNNDYVKIGEGEGSVAFIALFPYIVSVSEVEAAGEAFTPTATIPETGTYVSAGVDEGKTVVYKLRLPTT